MRGLWIARLRLVATLLLLALLLPLAFRSGLGLFVFPPYAVVGAILAMRRPGNAIGWIVVGSGAAFAVLLVPSIHATVAQFADGSVDGGEAMLGILTGGATGMGLFLLLFTLAAIFPSGHWPEGRVGRLARGALLIGGAATVACAFAPTLSLQLDGVPASVAVRNPLATAPSLPIWGILDPNVLTGPIFLLVLAAVVSLVVRYRRAVGVERQQLRWVVAAIAFLAAAVAAGFIISSIDPALGESGLAWIPALVAYPMIPLAIGMAVLRYRLYEIDRIVSRTISWTVTTGLVGGLFSGLIVALQAVFAPVTQESSLAVAGSTLVAAAVFQPARRRIQSAVDRRFNRGRYDAERVVGAFSGRLRDQVDLHALSDEIRYVVAETVRPATATVWLRNVPDHSTADAS